jgi:hypothetical protein
MVTADNRLPDGGEAGTWAECQRIGGLLADEALRIVKDAPVQEAPKLWCGSFRLVLPVDSPLMRQLLEGPCRPDVRRRPPRIVSRRWSTL